MTPDTWVEYPLAGMVPTLPETHGLTVAFVTQQGEQQQAVEAMLQHITNGWRQNNTDTSPHPAMKASGRQRSIVA